MKKDYYFPGSIHNDQSQHISIESITTEGLTALINALSRPSVHSASSEIKNKSSSVKQQQSTINSAEIIESVEKSSTTPEPKGIFAYIVPNNIKSKDEIENELADAAKGKARILAECVKKAEKIGYLDFKGLSKKEIFEILKEHYGLEYKYNNWVSYY